jgi:hypothetical protein
MCDTALNCFPGVSEIAVLADSPAFHIACEEANRIFRYPIESWAPPLARTALSNSELSQLYIDRQVRAALAGFRLDASSVGQVLSDAAGMVLTFWAELAPGYEVGAMIGDEAITWGWEAYLARRLTPMIAGAIGRGLYWSWSTRPFINEEREKISAKQPLDRWEGHLRSALIDALDELLTDDLLRNAFFALAYSEEPMGQIAASLGLSYHYLHTRLLAPLCKRIAKAADRSMQGHVRICGELRAAIAEVLTITDFTTRYATPLTVPAESEAPQKQNADFDSISSTDCQ